MKIPKIQNKQELFTFVSDPIVFEQMKIMAAIDALQSISSITLEDAIEKFRRGESEHKQSILDIDVSAEIQDESIDLFWYYLISQIQQSEDV